MREEISIKRKNEIELEMIKWLDTHDNIPPRKRIKRDGKFLLTSEMTEEEKTEVRLARRWDYFNDQKRDIKKASTTNQTLKKCDLNRIKRVVQWFKENRGRFPKSVGNDKEKLIYMTLKAPIFAKMIEEYEDLPLEEIPEEYREFIVLYREIPREEEDLKVIADWLDSHEGEMPRGSFSRNAKKLKRSEMSKEEHDEVVLNNKWQTSKARKILEKYEDTHIENIPKRYREYILRIREYGFGMSENLLFEEIIKWLDKNQDRLPRTIVEHKGRKITKEEIFEMNIRKKWNSSKINSILKEYEGRKIEEIPEEYREKIKILREYGLGLTPKDIEDKIFEWLSTHDGKMPRDVIKENGVTISRSKLSQKEYREIQLHEKWVISEMRKVLLEYAGKPIEEVPEKFRERILILRSYGFGKENIEFGNIFDEIIMWLKSHDGKFPRTRIEKTPLIRDMTDEERYEINLSHKWFANEERVEILKYARSEIDIEEIPENLREKVRLIRENTASLETLEERAERRFKEFITWLEEHNNQTPKSDVRIKGKRIFNEGLTPEQIYEKRLYKYWKISKIREILNQYVGRPIDEVPEEYREKVKILREHGLTGKTPTKRMKKAVKSKVGENLSTREELKSELILEECKDVLDE